MNNFKIIFEQFSKYSAVVCAVSYINPIEDIQSISKELREHLSSNSYILFDLLLSNGDSFNRFAEAFFDGNNITTDSIHIVKVPSDELQRINHYYRGKVKELSKGVLTKKNSIDSQ